jgi:glycosyltransferase involved in cell wall biosynthesis
MPALWAIAPVYNEEKSLPSFVAEWIPVFRRCAGEDFAFCLINDGSTDNSLQAMNQLSAEYQELIIVDKANEGHGPSCIAGYRKAVESGAEWIFQIDSDGQCDPADFEIFWQSRLSAPVQYGERKGREDGLARRFISRLLAATIFLMSFRWIRDPNVPYRLMHRNAMQPALRGIPKTFRLANVLLSLIHSENHEIEWHRIRFRQRSGRQSGVKIGFFTEESAMLVRDYVSWIFSSCRTNLPDAAVRIGRILVGYSAAYYIVVLLILAFLRAVVFTEYSWMESALLTEVHRILAGQNLYTAPSLEYVPLIYAPLYLYISSGVAFLFGEGYAALRLVSLAATLGILIIIWRMVRRMGAPAIAAWIAAGFYAGMYRVAGFSYDAGRLDSLFVFFVLLMAYHMWRAQEGAGRSVFYAAVTAVAAVLTKQTALVPIVLLSLWGIAAGNRRSRLCGCLCLGAAVLSQIAGIAATNGWFFYYLYGLPATHPILASNLKIFLTYDLWRRLSLGVVLSLLALATLWKKGSEGKQKALFCMLLVVALYVAGIIPRLKVGGDVNNLVPLAAGIALCCGLAAGFSLNRNGWAPAIILLLFIGFAAQIFYLPWRPLPPKKAAAAMQMKIALFQDIEAPIFAPCDPYLSQLANKNASAFWGAIYDVLLDPGPNGDILREDLRKAFETGKFRTVVLRREFFMQSAFPYSRLEKDYKIMEGWKEIPFGWEKLSPLVVYVRSQ